jgi:hypothetical protein
MADLSITASAVRGIKADSAPAAATLTAGEVVYKNTSNALALSDSNNTVAAIVNGITLNPADTGQPAFIHTSGPLTIQGGLTAGTFYYLSATPGAICPFADLVTGCRVIQIGYAISSTVLMVAPVDTGIVL